MTDSSGAWEKMNCIVIRHCATILIVLYLFYFSYNVSLKGVLKIRDASILVCVYCKTKKWHATRNVECYFFDCISNLILLHFVEKIKFRVICMKRIVLVFIHCFNSRAYVLKGKHEWNFFHYTVAIHTKVIYLFGTYYAPYSVFQSKHRKL